MKEYLKIYLSFFKTCCLITVFVFSILFFQKGIAQAIENDIKIQAGVDTEQIKIGEQFHLTLQATMDSENHSFSWAHVPDTFSHLMVVDRSGLDTIKQGGKWIFQQVYTLTGFDSGRWEIPAFPFHSIIDSSQSILSKPISIVVHSVNIDTTKPFKPIKEIKEVPFNIFDYWPYLLAGVILILIVLYFVFFYKRKEKQEKKNALPPEPPYEEAVRTLKSLEQKQLWQSGEVKEYYSELTDILRLYIHRLYGINALEQTSNELLEKVKKVTRLNQKRKELKHILEMADLAKFAKLSPLPEEHEECLRNAKDIVEWVKPQPEAENENEKKNKDK